MRPFKYFLVFILGALAMYIVLWIDVLLTLNRVLEQ